MTGASRGPWATSGGDAESAARRRFAELVASPDVPLVDAALALAQEEYPSLDPRRHLDALDGFARAVDERLERGRDAASVLRAMRAVLFDEAGFRGATDDYYDARNSFLNEVLERRIGIPITLSVVYMAVASRVGFPVEGVGFPGHFLVKHVAAGREVFVDAFHGGELLGGDELAARYRGRTGRDLPPGALDAVGPRAILARMLHNLKRIYAEARDDPRTLWVVDRLLLLSPDDPAERRDHGLVAARLGGARAAIADLEAYLAAAPGAADAEQIRELLGQLRASGTRLVN